MTPRELKIGLTLTFASPPSVGAGGSGGTLADKVVTRDGRGRFIIPASQVKGKLRHACEQLLRAEGVRLCRPPQPDKMCPQDDVRPSPCVLCRIFGSPRERSRLQFYDLVATLEDAPRESADETLRELPETLRPMVSLNRARRTAEAKRLFLIETAPHVNGLRFKNEEAVVGYVIEHTHVHLLLAGFRLLFSWGGGTSRGLGWAEVEAWAALDGEPVSFDVNKVRTLKEVEAR